MCKVLDQGRFAVMYWTKIRMELGVRPCIVQLCKLQGLTPFDMLLFH